MTTKASHKREAASGLFTGMVYARLVGRQSPLVAVLALISWHVRAKTSSLSKASYDKGLERSGFILFFLIFFSIAFPHPASAAIEAGKRFFSLQKQKGVNIIQPSGGGHAATDDFMALKKYKQSQAFPEVKVLRLTPLTPTKIPAGRDFRQASLMHNDTLEGTLPDLPEDGEFTWPIPRNNKQYISSPFGYRTHPVTGKYSLHAGIDIAADAGTPIVAAHSGMVEEIGHDGRLGTFIKIRRDAKSYSVYGHLSATHVHEGETIIAGMLIGNVGSSGRTTGSHLHYSFEVAEHPVNPMQYFGGTATAHAKKIEVLAAND